MKKDYQLMETLSGLSAQDLTRLATMATELAVDLKAAQPTIALALAAGVRDCGYNTQSNGYIPMYRGQGEIKMADGSRWLAIGHDPEGNASWVSKDGWVEFVPLPRVAEEVEEEALLAG